MIKMLERLPSLVFEVKQDRFEYSASGKANPESTEEDSAMPYCYPDLNKTKNMRRRRRSQSKIERNGVRNK